MLATAYVMRVRISWFGKHTLFRKDCIIHEHSI